MHDGSVGNTAAPFCLVGTYFETELIILSNFDLSLANYRPNRAQLVLRQAMVLTSAPVTAEALNATGATYPPLDSLSPGSHWMRNRRQSGTFQICLVVLTFDTCTYLYAPTANTPLVGSLVGRCVNNASLERHRGPTDGPPYARKTRNCFGHSCTQPKRPRCVHRSRGGIALLDGKAVYVLPHRITWLTQINCTWPLQFEFNAYHHPRLRSHKLGPEVGRGGLELQPSLCHHLDGVLCDRPGHAHRDPEHG